METFNKIVEFIGSYPPWARVSALVAATFIFGLILVVPRSSSPATAAAAAGKNMRVYMRIKPLQIFPEDPDAEVSLSAFINGTEYIHPSVGIAKWMTVGPDMSPKIFEIPRADRYEVRFEMRLRSGKTLAPRIRQSQVVTPVAILPFSDQYRLYDVNRQVRSAAVSAIVNYDIFQK